MPNQLSHLTDEQCNQLATLIRDGKCIEALTVARKLIGPTRFELDASSARIKMMDWLWEQSQWEGWGCDPEQWPHSHRDTYLRIAREQTEFENRYL